jgi:para-nitrobenzyl esterase
MTTPEIVSTAAGRLAGSQVGRVRSFLGIPYADTTAGEGRFAPPRHRGPWTGVRDARTFGPACPQPPIRDNLLIRPEVERAMFGLTDEPMSEDCLTLNLWTPAADDGARPVLVSYHGGGFKSGSGNPRSAPWFDGTRLALRGDVVVVSVNHRIGLLGFLALPEVPGSGNAGMLDLNAALAWVRDNAAGFGGDPARVTVFGESGGGSKVSIQMAMPGAAGLLQRAGSQSGPTAPTSADQAAEITAAVAAHVGSAAVDDLRALPVERLLDAALAVSAQGLQFRPTIDGDTLPVAPLDAFAAGVAASVPLVIGWTRDEATVFLREPRDLGWDALGERAPADVVDAYRALHPSDDPWTLLMRISTDRQFRLPALALARAKAAAGGAGAYVFEFAWETPVLGGSLGAGHGVDVSFPFDNTDLHSATAGSPSARRLAPLVSDAWIALARDGDPNHPGLPDWPRYGEDGATLVFADESRLEYRS